MADDDLLAPVVSTEEQHYAFRLLVSSPKHEPHREMLRAVWAVFPNLDGGFVREFQAEHFDRRLWEMYVFAVGFWGPFNVSRPQEAPDFLFEKDGHAVWIEATTANPSPTNRQKKAETRDELINEMNEVLAIRLGSPLYSKLTERYWERPHVQGKPFVIALGDFSQGAGPRHSDFALHRYLYGLDARIVSLPGEVVRLEKVKVETHTAWKTIPSGFFNLPEAYPCGGGVGADGFSTRGYLSCASKTPPHTPALPTVHASAFPADP